MKQRISEAKRQRLREHPLTRPGIKLRPDQQQALRDLLDAGDTAGAQQLILRVLHIHIDGPNVRKQIRDGRRRIVAVEDA